MHEGVIFMFGIIARERIEEWKETAAFLNSADYNQKMDELLMKFERSTHLESGLMADEPTLLFACKLLRARYKKVCKIARKIDKDIPDKFIHNLRIQCKKLRYSIEFFSSLFPRGETKKLITSLKTLQDNLGRFNDFSVQKEFFHTFLTQHSMAGKCNASLAESIGALIKALHQRKLNERNQIQANFARFDSPDVRAIVKTVFPKRGE